MNNKTVYLTIDDGPIDTTEHFLDVMKKHHSHAAIFVVGEMIKVRENIIRRMSGRRACLNCGATYHIAHVPPKTEGICDRCGNELILRDDDKEETVKNRLAVYHEQTQPLIDFYTAKGVLKDVDGTQDMQVVFDSIIACLEA